MRIYYFGELIEIDGRKVVKQTENEQTRLEFDEQPDKKPGLMSIGDILKEIDLSMDIYRPLQEMVR